MNLYTRPTVTDLRLTIKNLSREDADKLATTLAKLAHATDGTLNLTDHGITPEGLTVKTGTRKIV